MYNHKNKIHEAVLSYFANIRLQLKKVNIETIKKDSMIVKQRNTCIKNCALRSL